MKLRAYQDRAIKLTGDRLRAGDKKVMIFLATGAGKSILFKEMIAKLVNSGRTVLFVVRRRELVFQAYEKHFRPIGLQASMVMAGENKKFNPRIPLQIASIDTLSRRVNNPKYDFIKRIEYIFIDECHDCTSPSYNRVLSQIDFKGAVGLTATPFPIGNKVHNFWESCVKPIEIHELIEKGFLTDSRIYAPFKIDLSQIKTIGADFDQAQLFDKMSELSVIGDIVNTYQKYGMNKPAILFAVNIAHSKMMTEAFNRAGISAIHCDQASSKEDRAKAILGLENGAYKILCNVNIFSTGVDIKGIGVGIMARPTQSEVLYIQQIGRVLRPYKICGNCKGDYIGEQACPFCGSFDLYYTKKHAIILDHGCNVDRHGLPDKVRDAVLTKKDKKKKSGTGSLIKLKQCPECFMYIKNHIKVCPACDHEIKPTEIDTLKEVDGELHLLNKEDFKERQRLLILETFSKEQERKRYTKWHCPYTAIFKKFGVEVFDYIKFPEHLNKKFKTNLILANSARIYK